jgi:hypothetical protein
VALLAILFFSLGYLSMSNKEGMFGLDMLTKKKEEKEGMATTMETKEKKETKEVGVDALKKMFSVLNITK